MKTIIFECKDGVFAFSTKDLTIKNILDFEKQHKVINVHYVRGGKNMVEKKVYKDWFFKEDGEAQRDMNMIIYNELINKYKCLRKDKPTQEDLDNYDFVYGFYYSGYCNNQFVVYKKPDVLTDDEVMLILDNGNLCFGGIPYGYYLANGFNCKCYKIFTD